MNNTGVLLDDPELKADQKNNLEKLVKEKDERLEETLKETDNTIQADPDGEFYSITVTNYKQERNYWCGPASARQSLSFHKSKSGSTTSLPSQNTLSSLIGTEYYGASTTTGIVKALNNYKSTFGFSANPYVAADITNVSNPQSTFEARIKGVLRNRTNAPIVLVETQYLPRYGGTTLRHYFTISGYSYEYATGKKTVKTAKEITKTDPNYPIILSPMLFKDFVAWTELGDRQRRMEVKLHNLKNNETVTIAALYEPTIYNSFVFMGGNKLLWADTLEGKGYYMLYDLQEKTTETYEAPASHPGYPKYTNGKIFAINFESGGDWTNQDFGYLDIKENQYHSINEKEYYINFFDIYDDRLAILDNGNNLSIYDFKNGKLTPLDTTIV